MLPIKDNIPSHRKPFINYLIILINTCVFIYQMFLSPQEGIIFVRNYGFIPQRFLLNFPSYSYTILTCMFIHGNFAHFLEICGSYIYLETMLKTD